MTIYIVNNKGMLRFTNGNARNKSYATRYK